MCSVFQELTKGSDFVEYHTNTEKLQNDGSISVIDFLKSMRRFNGGIMNNLINYRLLCSTIAKSLPSHKW